MTGIQLKEIETLSNKLRGMATTIKEKKDIFSNVSTKEVALLILRECERIVDEKDSLYGTTLYTKLVSDKNEGKILDIETISREMLVDLVYKSDKSAVELAGLFDTTVKNVESIKRRYKLDDTYEAYNAVKENINTAYMNVMSINRL